DARGVDARREPLDLVSWWIVRRMGIDVVQEEEPRLAARTDTVEPVEREVRHAVSARERRATEQQRIDQAQQERTREPTGAPEVREAVLEERLREQDRVGGDSGCRPPGPAQIRSDGPRRGIREAERLEAEIRRRSPR